MKTVAIAVASLVFCAGIAFAADDTSSDSLEGTSPGRPRVEYTAGNYLDFRLVRLHFSPAETVAESGFDYWSGYHHISFPIGGKTEMYVGVGWGVIDVFAEIGIGWRYARSADVTWEPHMTVFGGPVYGSFSNGVVTGIRSAMKFQLNSDLYPRIHVFLGIGLTAALQFHLKVPDLALSVPFETGLSISSRKKKQ